MSAVDAMPAFTGLVTRFEQEVAGLEQQKVAAAQNLKAMEATQKDLTDRIAVLMAQMKMEEGKVAEAQEHGRQILGNAERQAFGVLKSAQMDADALRGRMRAAIEAMKLTLEGVS
jgi:cell division septum initiation protein DivIVA